MGCLSSKERQQPQGSAAAAPPEPEPEPEPSVKTEGTNIGPEVLAPGINPVVELVITAGTRSHPQADLVCSIVFLHGLTGSRDGTWTAEGSSESWLTTFLAKDFPKARIITYGYDADVVHLTKAAGLNTVRQHASNLLLDLSTLRSDSDPPTFGRPIIFAAHSLGGLVCQDAIFSCNNATKDSYRDILKCTYGVIYFGTPHAGSDLAKYAKAAADLVNLSLFKAPNRALLHVLTRDSEVLANIENEFSKLVNNRVKDKKPIDLFVFVEEKPVNRIGRRVVEPSSAVIKGYESATIAADHMGMTKFSSRDNDYKRFTGVLRDWIKEIEKVTGPSRDPKLQESQTEPNDPNLGRDNYYQNRGNVKYHIRRATFLQNIDESFETRRENRSHIVILYALGGQGKTQLAIDYCHRGHLDRRFYAIFFLDASSEDVLREGMIALAELLSSAGQIFDNDAHRLRFVLGKIYSWNRRWLLVFDNYDKPKAYSIEEYIPHSGFGHVLITSRFKGLDDLGEVLSVPPMSRVEAKELLFSTLEIGDFSAQNGACALRIVEALGYLPLAIHQAGAFMRRKRLPLEQFLEQYEIRKEEIWSQTPKVWTYGGTVYTTWELSYDLIDETDDGRSNKGALLTMLAFLDFRGISREMFNLPRSYPGIQISQNDSQGLIEPPWLHKILRNDGTWDLFRIDDIFDDFRELSLLQISDRSKQNAFKISLHPLVAEWIRYRVRKDKQRELQCLFQASALVVASMEALKTAQISRLLSEQSQREVLKHQAACLLSLKEYRDINKDSAFVSDLDAMLRLGQLTETVRPGQVEQPEGKGKGSATEKRSSQQMTQPTGQPVSKAEYVDQSLAMKVRQHRDDPQVQKRMAILRWICDIDNEERYQYLLSVKAPGTCEWFFEQENYTKWLNGNSRVLLLTGRIGSGKTVLSAAVIDRLRHIHQGEESVATAFYFCDRREISGDIGVGTVILRAFLRQLLYSRDHIPESIEDLYDTRTRLVPPSNMNVFQALRDILDECERVHILIDGFDELPREDQKTVMAELGKFLNEFGQIRILISSRGAPFPSHPIAEAALTIDTTAAGNIDVDLYLNQQLTSGRFQRLLGVEDDIFKEELRKTLARKADGMFLWVKLVLDHSAQQPTRSGLRQALAGIPPSLSTIFDASLEKIQQQEPSKRLVANIVLIWLLACISPLSTLEMFHAVTFSMRRREPDNDVLNLEEIDLVSSCQGLVVLLDGETRVITLLHESVKSWAYKHEPALFPDGDSQIASTCIGYIREASNEQKQTGEQTSELLLQYPLLVYAAKSWPAHAIRQERAGEISIFLRMRDIVSFWLAILAHEGISVLKTGSGTVLVSLHTLEPLSPKAMAEALNLKETAAWIRDHEK